MAYDFVKIRFIKEKEVILNGNTNDKSRGIQLIGPGYLQKVIKGVNWLLSPINALSLSRAHSDGTREKQVNASAEGSLIDNLTVVNGEITASKNLAYFMDMTRFIPFTKPQDIFRHELAIS